MPKVVSFDFLVIGGGSGGMAGARRAASLYNESFMSWQIGQYLKRGQKIDFKLCLS
jgi:hypothetical protein